MNIQDVKALLSQKAIPIETQKKAYKKVLELIRDEKEVEVIASTRNIMIDVYNEHGEKIDTFTYTFPTTIIQPSENKFQGVEVCGY